MAKKRTMNELRQTKEYKLSDQGGEYNVPFKGAEVQEIQATKQMAEIDKQEKNYGYRAPDLNGDHGEEIYEPEDIEVVKEAIVDKITRHFRDMVFEMVCEEMGKNYLFQSQTYLTEEGYEMFEDEWFEFYHEHHGDIMHEVMKNITN